MQYLFFWITFVLFSMMISSSTHLPSKALILVSQQLGKVSLGIWLHFLYLFMCGQTSGLVPHLEEQRECSSRNKQDWSPTGLSAPLGRQERTGILTGCSPLKSTFLILGSPPGHYNWCLEVNHWHLHTCPDWRLYRPLRDGPDCWGRHAGPADGQITCLGRQVGGTCTVS